SHLTDQRFQPAQLNWDGIAAAELDAAPVPVRRDVGQASDAMVWLAGTLRYWRGQVAQFNDQVTALRDEQAAAAANHWGVPTGTPGFAHEVQVARAEVLRGLRERWWSAYQQYIDEGSRTAAAMLREGPTADNLRRLTEAGVWR